MTRHQWSWAHNNGTRPHISPQYHGESNREIFVLLSTTILLNVINSRQCISPPTPPSLYEEKEITLAQLEAETLVHFLTDKLNLVEIETGMIFQLRRHLFPTSLCTGGGCCGTLKQSHIYSKTRCVMSYWQPTSFKVIVLKKYSKMRRHGRNGGERHQIASSLWTRYLALNSLRLPSKKWQLETPLSKP